MNEQNRKIVRIEICGATFNALIVAIIGLTIVGFTGILSHYYTQRITAAFSAGYEETTLPGRAEFAWKKHTTRRDR